MATTFSTGLFACTLWMMDISTFNEFKPFQKSHSARQVLLDAEMALLNTGERETVALLMELSGMRLEQEHISHSFVEATLKRLLALK